jgi:IAA-amino acid hydrolase
MRFILPNYLLHKGQAAVHRCTCEVDFTGTEHPSIPPTVINDARISEHVRRVSIGILGEGNHNLSPSFMGSEDFAFYLDKINSWILFYF